MNDTVLFLIVLLTSISLLFGFHAIFRDPTQRQIFSPPSSLVPPVMFRIGKTCSDGTLTVLPETLEAICKGSTAWSRQRASLNPGTPERNIFDRLVTLYTLGGYSLDNKSTALANPQYPPQPPINCPIVFFNSRGKPTSAIFGARARCPSLVLAICALRPSNNDLTDDDSVLANALYPSFSCAHHDVSTMLTLDNDDA